MLLTEIHRGLAKMPTSLRKNHANKPDNLPDCAVDEYSCVTFAYKVFAIEFSRLFVAGPNLFLLTKNKVEFYLLPIPTI